MIELYIQRAKYILLVCPKPKFTGIKKVQQYGQHDRRPTERMKESLNLSASQTNPTLKVPQARSLLRVMAQKMAVASSDFLSLHSSRDSFPGLNQIKDFARFPLLSLMLS